MGWEGAEHRATGTEDPARRGGRTAPTGAEAGSEDKADRDGGPGGAELRPRPRRDPAAHPVPGRSGDARLVAQARPPRFLSEVTGIFWQAVGWRAEGKEEVGAARAATGIHGRGRELHATSRGVHPFAPSRGTQGRSEFYHLRRRGQGGISPLLRSSVLGTRSDIGR